MISKSTLVGLLFSVSAGAQSLVVIEGPTSANLTVRLLDEAQLVNGGGSVLLQGIEVLPIEITGHTASQELDGTSARVEIRNGMPRVELPGIGRVFAYRRQAGAFWGFLFTPLRGGARVLLERPAAGGNSPFADRIAVARDGVHAVIPELGGSVCHIVRLDGGTLRNGLSARTIVVPGGLDNTGLMVGPTTAFATGNDRLLRFALAAGDAVDMTPTIAVARPRLKPELAMSGDGSKVVFLYGGSNSTLQLYLLDAHTPAAVLLPPAPGKYEEPGYFPEASGDVRLLLNEDGSRLFYIENRQRAGGNGGDESYVLDTTAGLPTLQITSDAHFQPWVGIHILPSFYGTKLLAAIGDVDLMDWFQAELTAGGGTVTNVTATGPVVQPFNVGTLIPSKIKAVGNLVFATDVATTATKTLRALDVTSAASTVLSQTVSADLKVGAALGTVPDVFVPGIGDSLYSGLTGALIGTTPPGVHVTAPLTMPLCGVTSVELAAGFSAVLFYLPTGEVVLGPLVQGLQQMVLTPGGGLLISSASGLLYLSLSQPNLAVPQPNPGIRVFVTGANA